MLLVGRANRGQREDSLTPDISCYKRCERVADDEHCHNCPPLCEQCACTRSPPQDTSVVSARYIECNKRRAAAKRRALSSLDDIRNTVTRCNKAMQGPEDLHLTYCLGLLLTCNGDENDRQHQQCQLHSRAHQCCQQLQIPRWPENIPMHQLPPV